jgi:hypothetical protein
MDSLLNLAVRSLNPGGRKGAGRAVRSRRGPAFANEGDAAWRECIERNLYGARTPEFTCASRSRADGPDGPQGGHRPTGTDASFVTLPRSR